MSRNSSAQRRRLFVEQLERREVFSGMVTAAIEGGSLVIRGDAEANQLTIWRGAFGDLVYVAGSKNGTIAGSETRVNGSILPVLLNGFKNDIRLDMRPGNDSVSIMDLTVNGAIYANMGSGDDSLFLDGTATGTLPFNPLNDGTTDLPNGDLVVKGNVQFQGVTDNDRLLIDTSASGSTIGGSLYFDGGQGNDTLNFKGSNVQLDTSVPPAADDGQNDIAGSLFLQSGLGDDSVWLERVVAGGSVSLSDYNGNNNAAIIGVKFGGDVSVNLGSGNDIVTVRAPATVSIPEEPAPQGLMSMANNVSISTGAGNDVVNVGSAKLQSLTVLTGTGDEGGDHFGVSLTDLEIAQDLHVDTGAGFDNVLLDHVTAANIRVFTGTNSDGIIAKSISAHEAWFDSGADGDITGFYDSQLDNFRVVLGGGSDQIYLSGMVAFYLADIDGGDSTNAYFDLTRNVFRKLNKRGF